MNGRLLELATRHGVLKARIDAQRLELARHAAPLEKALAVGDKALEGVDWLKHHPVAVGAAVVAVVIARPKRAWRWARSGIFVWRGWQTLKNTLARVG